MEGGWSLNISHSEIGRIYRWWKQGKPFASAIVALNANNFNWVSKISDWNKWTNLGIKLLFFDNTVSAIVIHVVKPIRLLLDKGNICVTITVATHFLLIATLHWPCVDLTDKYTSRSLTRGHFWSDCWHHFCCGISDFRTLEKDPLENSSTIFPSTHTIDNVFCVLPLFLWIFYVRNWYSLHTICSREIRQCHDCKLHLPIFSSSPLVCGPKEWQLIITSIFYFAANKLGK